MITPRKLAEVKFAGISEIGNARSDNQDAILVPDSPLPNMFTFLAGLADGMGGYESGDIASKLALNSFRQVVIDSRGMGVEKMLSRAVEVANMKIIKTAREIDVGHMGTTLTAMYVFGDQLYLAHVGDSRAYLLRNSTITCLTNDHTIVGDLVRSKLITPHKVREHEQRSILTKALGLELFVTPEITSHKILPGDRLMICSDGVWAAIEDDGILKLSDNLTIAEAFGQELINTALSNHSDDNCSVIVADFQYFHPLSPPAVETPRKKWFLVF